MEPLKIKVVNHLTGEISEKELKGPDAAEQYYLELKASQKATEEAMKKILAYLENWLGEDDEQVFVDGKRIVRVQRETRTWTTEGLRNVGLDEDALSVVLKVNMTAAKFFIDEAIERGDIKPDAKKVLNESAEVTATKPYVQIK